MSKDRDCALLLGVGSVEEVALICGNLPMDQEDIADDLSTVSNAVLRILPKDGGFKCLAPLLCAILNTQFEKTGHFYRLNGTGGISHKYFASDSDREFIIMIAGL